MILQTLLPRRFKAATHGVIALGLGMLLALAACQAPTVPKRPAGTQPAQQQPLPPADAAGDTPGSAEMTELEALLAGTAVTRVDLDQGARVALLLPLSGRHARVGQAMLNAAQIALFDIAGDRFTLVVRDTRGTPEGAQEAILSVLREGAHLVLGPLFATSVEAVAGDVRAAQLNMVAFSNDRSVAGEGVFVMGLGPIPQVHRLIGFARSRGLTRFAVLAPRTPYGSAVVDALREATLRGGVELSRVVTYAPDAPDISAEARLLADYDRRRQELMAQRQVLAARNDEASRRALKRLDGLDTLGTPDFDAVLLPEGGQRLQTVAPTLAYFDVDPAEIRYMGTSLWEDSKISTEPVLYGGWFTAPQPELWADFKARYKDLYGTSPPRVASLAYDATALAAVLTRSAYDAGQLPEFSVQALTQTSGFAGIDGAFRFLPSGEVERSLAVMAIEKGGSFKVLDDAPRSFQVYSE